MHIDLVTYETILYIRYMRPSCTDHWNPYRHTNRRVMLHGVGKIIEER
jgi:hypothetical protein